MKALILAAGLGNRLGDLTKERPKAMAKVAGRELILRVFDFLDHASIGAKAVVTGYCAEMLTDFVSASAPRTTLFHNPHFRQGSIVTIETAIPFLDDDTLIMNVDHIYPKRMLPVILKSAAGITAVCDFDRALGADDMKVKLINPPTPPFSKGGQRGDLIKIGKYLTDFDCGYIGMTFVKRTHLADYIEAVGETRKIYGDDAPVEWVLGHMAANDREISICDASGIGWLEVDTGEDLRIAETRLETDKDFLK